jgi:hypothetical protein
MDVYAQEIPASVKRMVQRDEAAIFAGMKKRPKPTKRVV